MQMYLNEQQVIDLIKKAEREDEVIVVRCIRKGKASKLGGPDAGDEQDLHCTKKPPHTPSSGSRGNREAEDANSNVLTVYVSNRRNKEGKLGDWRRVNVAKVTKVTYKNKDYAVTRI